MIGRGINHDWTLNRLHSHPVRKILVIKLRAIGDVLLSTIVTKNLRTAFPDAQIDFLTEHPSRDIIEGNSFLSNQIVFHTKKDSFFSLLRRVRSTRYDLVFDLFCNPRSAQITFATRAPVRVGYPFRGRKYAYNVKVISRSDYVHNTEFNLDPLTALGIPIVDRNTYFPFDDNARETARNILAPAKPSGPIIALNSGCASDARRWGYEHYAELGDLFIERYNASIVLLWGPGEEEGISIVKNSMKHEPIVPPLTTLKELGALLSLCDYSVSNDTGPMHISAAVGTPVLSIVGPTNPLNQGPYNEKSAWVRLEGLECLACNLTSCNIGTMCMKDLSAATVFEAFERMKIAAEEA